MQNFFLLFDALLAFLRPQLSRSVSLYGSAHGDRSALIKAGYRVEVAVRNCACHLALNMARGTSCPRRYTLLIRRVLEMLSRGFASRTMKSALLPGATMP